MPSWPTHLIINGGIYLNEEFSRMQLLIGEEAVEKLKQSKIVVFGVGGVGGFVVEALARCAVGKLVLVDNDTVNISNINRQLVALHSTVGKFKVDVMREHILDINPKIEVDTYKEFYLPGKLEFLFSNCDYVVDAIDTVSAKIDIAVKCYQKNIPLISAMGAGNKLSAEKFEIADIFETSECPLCRVMRHELKKRSVEKLKVVFSKEKPITAHFNTNPENDGKLKKIPGSIAFVPSTAGLLVAGEVVKDLISKV